MLAIGYLMVSKIEFFSIKQFKLAGFRLRGRLFLAAVIGLTWYNPMMGLLLISSCYVLSGPYLGVRHKLPPILGGGSKAPGQERGKVIPMV